MRKQNSQRAGIAMLVLLVAASVPAFAQDITDDDVAQMIRVLEAGFEYYMEVMYPLLVEQDPDDPPPGPAWDVELAPGRFRGSWFQAIGILEPSEYYNYDFAGRQADYLAVRFTPVVGGSPDKTWYLYFPYDSTGHAEQLLDEFRRAGSYLSCVWGAIPESQNPAAGRMALAMLSPNPLSIFAFMGENWLKQQEEGDASEAGQ